MKNGRCRRTDRMLVVRGKAKGNQPVPFRLCTAVPWRVSCGRSPDVHVPLFCWDGRTYVYVWTLIQRHRAVIARSAQFHNGSLLVEPDSTTASPAVLRSRHVTKNKGTLPTPSHGFLLRLCSKSAHTPIFLVRRSHSSLGS